MLDIELTRGTLKIMLEHMDDVLGEPEGYSYGLEHIGEGYFRAGFYSWTIYKICEDGELLVWYDTYALSGIRPGTVPFFYEDIDAFVMKQTQIIEEMFEAA
jgi:hypothetical protein